MSVLDLHPEDLFDREASGALTADERVRLEAHLAQCALCRFERQVSADLDHELAAYESPSVINHLVNTAIGAPSTLKAGAITANAAALAAAAVANLAATENAIEAPSKAAPSAKAPSVGKAAPIAKASSVAKAAPAATKPTAAPEAAPLADDEFEVPAGLPIPLRARAWRRRFVFLFAAALLLITGAAAGANGLAGRVWNIARQSIGAAFSPTPPEEPTAAPAAPALKGKHRVPPSSYAPSTTAAHDTNDSTETNDVSDSVAPGTSVAPSDHEPFGTTVSATPSLIREPTLAASSLQARNDAPAGSYRGETFGIQPAKPLALGSAPTAAPRATPSAAHVASAPGAVRSVPNAPIPSVFAPIATAEPESNASTLFDRATTSRRRGDAATAATIYHELQRRFPGSPESRLSVAIVARMALDRADNSAALSGFDSYLRSGDGELREEAMAGRALALERLGSSAENDAWNTLVRTYPHSSYAAHAEKRLKQGAP